ncbi:MAG: helix-hairpin-helix domain-containing protein [Candidatus Bathyarchaeia archaeon]
MRSDYTLYVVAIICFIMAAVIFAADYVGYRPMPSEISVVTTAVLTILGLVSAGAGYLVRPEEMIPPPPPRPPAPKTSAPPPIPPPKTTVTPPIGITEVKGIGLKRAEQLRALGINTAQDLAETKATTLAAKTELSPKITRKWVREAKRLIKEAA